MISHARFFFFFFFLIIQENEAEMMLNELFQHFKLIFVLTNIFMTYNFHFKKMHDEL